MSENALQTIERLFVWWTSLPVGEQEAWIHEIASLKVRVDREIWEQDTERQRVMADAPALDMAADVAPPAVPSTTRKRARK
jgi:hypothetical protein